MPPKTCLYTSTAATTVSSNTNTSYYKSNAFGLQTADKAGKIIYESSPGNHMKFTMEEFYAWCDKYLCATCN